jgi:glycosyltransferase involved in cell wall biosynthesis
MFYRLLLCFFVIAGYAQEKTVCLNMIVKNESRVIQRCLESVKDLVDYWVIVDTGSTDDTEQLIRETMRGIPGELHERSWVNFEYNRNEALHLARQKGDYLLILDADEHLEGKRDLPPLDRDCFFITVREAKTDYQRIFLIDNSLPWRWEGVLHETLLCEQATTFDLLEQCVLMSKTDDGYRSQDPQKYWKDAQVLEEVLRKDPNNSRNVFYLAQCYRNGGHYPFALQQYQKRATMGDWDEEVFWSLYQIGIIQQILGADSAAILDSFIKAFQYRPSRSEPLYRIAEIYTNQKDYFAAYITARCATSIPIPPDHVFLERWIYNYGHLLIQAHAAFELHFYAEAEELCRKILLEPTLPAEYRMSAEKNLKLLIDSRVK